MTYLAFVGMSLVWSFSWFAMKLQVDSSVAVEVSLFYRFLAVACVMTVLCLITKKRLKPINTEYKYFALIALTNFSLNFLIGYHTTKFIPSGMIAVIFSLSIITSEILKAIFDGKKISIKIIISSLVGFCGLALFIYPTLKFDKDSSNLQFVIGIGLAMVMMIVFSCGNYLVEKNKRQNNTPLFSSIAFGSIASSLYLGFLNLILDNKFTIDYSPKYLFSLLYQIFFASIIAFLCFYYLIQKIGAVKANYTALVYPTIALIVSSFFENFRFTALGNMGLVLIILALAIEFTSNKIFTKIVNVVKTRI